MNITEIIEKDDLDSFKEIFIPKEWQHTITTIENYANSYNTYSKSMDNCDVFKYSVHCGADKIFSYLLPLVNTDKHGENYGWPVLSMALNNQRYDYANAIINHATFDPYPIYHINSFKHIDSRNNPSEHIEFLFNYLEKLDKYDFIMSHTLYYFVDLVCYNEDTYDRSQDIYRKKINNPNAFLLDMFESKLSTLAEQVFYYNFKPFILDKLPSQKLKTLIESTNDSNIIFTKLFEEYDTIQGLKYLLIHPDLLQKHFDKNPVMGGYLSLEAIIFLNKNNIDFFKVNSEKRSPIDFILENNLEDEKTKYFADNFTNSIIHRLSETNKKSKVLEYCLTKVNNNKKIKPN